jgi:hypothetical protein
LVLPLIRVGITEASMTRRPSQPCRAIAARYAWGAAASRKDAATGALNLNLHFHMLFLDGVDVYRHGRPRFQWVRAPTRGELNDLAECGDTHRSAYTWTEPAH